MRHTFKLEEEIFKKLTEVDQSITMWSLDLGKIELQADAAKEQLRGLYGVRQQVLRKVVGDAGFDLGKVQDIKIGKGGQLMVLMDPAPENPPPEGAPQPDSGDPPPPPGGVPNSPPAS